MYHGCWGNTFYFVVVVDIGQFFQMMVENKGKKMNSHYTKMSHGRDAGKTCSSMLSLWQHSILITLT